MKKRTESDIVRAIYDYLQTQPGMYWRNNTVGVWDVKRGAFRMNPHHKKGSPDLIGISPSGRFVGIEVKKPGKYPNKEQRKFATEANALGALVFTARSVEDVIVQLKNGPPSPKA